MPFDQEYVCKRAARTNPCRFHEADAGPEVELTIITDALATGLRRQSTRLKIEVMEEYAGTLARDTKSPGFLVAEVRNYVIRGLWAFYLSVLSRNTV